MDNLRNDLQCPISMDFFNEPVIASDTHTYSQRELNQWIEST